MNQKTFEVMSHFKNIQYEWSIGSNYDIVTEFLPLLPARTKYTLDMDNFDLKTDPDLDEKLRMLNWNEKRICSISSREIQKLNILTKLDKLFKNLLKVYSCKMFQNYISKCSAFKILIFYIS